MMTLSMNQASMFQSVEKRCTVITLSHSKQPSGCSFLRQIRSMRADPKIPRLVWMPASIVLDLFYVHAMFSS
jgi:hypothetical protein